MITFPVFKSRKLFLSKKFTQDLWSRVAKWWIRVWISLCWYSWRLKLTVHFPCLECIGASPQLKCAKSTALMLWNELSALAHTHTHSEIWEVESVISINDAAKIKVVGLFLSVTNHVKNDACRELTNWWRAAVLMMRASQQESEPHILHLEWSANSERLAILSGWQQRLVLLWMWDQRCIQRPPPAPWAQITM